MSTQKDRFRRAKDKLEKAARRLDAIRLGDVGKSNADGIRSLRDDMDGMAHQLGRWAEELDEREEE